MNSDADLESRCFLVRPEFKHHLKATAIFGRIHHAEKYCDESFPCYNEDMSKNFEAFYIRIHLLSYGQFFVLLVI